MKRLLAGLFALFATAAAAAAVDAPQPGVDRALAATLVIRSADGEAAFLGSGFVWGSDGLALTNAHVVGDAETVMVEDRAGHRIAVPVVARDPRRDIAVLRLPEPRAGLEPAARQPVIGEPVLAIGAPMGLGFTVTSGIVAADPRQIEPAVPLRMVQHDAAINPGSSGGPLVDPAGRLVGMNSQIANGSRLYFGISYAISAQDLAHLVPGLVAGTLPPVADLGLDLRAIDLRMAQALNLGPTGLLVDDVLPGGKAEAAGLLPGDVLLDLMGQPLTEPGDLAFLLETAGDTARFTVRRGDWQDEVAVPLRAQARPTQTSGVAATPATLAGFSVVLDDTGLVTSLDSGSAPARAGLAQGDRILRLNGLPADKATLADTTLHAAFVLLVERDGRHLHVIVDPWSARQARLPAGGGNRLDTDVARF